MPGDDRCHCWYEPSLDEWHGHCVYRVGGSDVKVTTALWVEAQVQATLAPDAVYLGVGTYVRSAWKDDCPPIQGV